MDRSELSGDFLKETITTYLVKRIKRGQNPDRKKEKEAN